MVDSSRTAHRWRAPGIGLALLALGTVVGWQLHERSSTSRGKLGFDTAVVDRGAITEVITGPRPSSVGRIL